MISSLNSYSGLSAAEILKLFSASSSSSSSKSSSGSDDTNSGQSLLTGASSTSANDPVKAIQAILADANMGSLKGSLSFSITALAAYADQTGVAQQISDALATVNNYELYASSGTQNYSTLVNVTAATPVVNVSISSGGMSLATVQGSGNLGELPSLSSIETAYKNLKIQNQEAGLDGIFNGTFTLVQLPAGTAGGGAGNVAVLAADDDTRWALVLPTNAGN